MEKIDAPLDKPVQCLGCARTTLGYDQLPTGWIAEIWKTEGGQDIQFVSCYPCRSLTTPYDGIPRRAGRPPSVEWRESETLEIALYNSLIPALYTVKRGN